MSFAGHNKLPTFVCELERSMGEVISAGGFFNALREQVHNLAKTSEFSVFGPELIGPDAVVEVQDGSWNYLATVRVPVSQRILENTGW